MEIITLKELKEKRRPAFVWVEVGDGKLLEITSIHEDWWVGTPGRSWACTPSDRVYIFDNEEEKQKNEKLFMEDLRSRRAFSR